MHELEVRRGAVVARVNDRRDKDEDETTEVEFADPDSAVRERVDEMELTDAGREIDAVVRDKNVARTRIAEEIEESVEGFLDADGDEDGMEDGKPEQSTLGDVS